MKKYKLLKNRFDFNKDTIVYDLKASDYGLSNDDTIAEGIEHISVTLKEDGDYPFFTVSVEDLVEVIWNI